jgi:thioredoxin-related protein
MKTNILVLVLLVSLKSLSFAQAPAQEINWISISEAEKLNQENPRKVIVDIYTDWCGWCKRLDATTYKDPAVVDYINKHFYAVKYNAEFKESITYKGTIYSYNAATRVNSLSPVLMGSSTGYPTTTFLSEKMEVLSAVSGYQQAPMMLNILTYFGGNHYLNTDWNTFLSSQTPTAK